MRNPSLKTFHSLRLDATAQEIVFIESEKELKTSGHGFLNRFKTLKDVENEKIDINNVRRHSHEAF